MRAHIGAIAVCLAFAGLAVAAEADDHNEQRPSQISESAYCQSAPWTVRCDTPEETALRAARAERAKRDAKAIDGGNALIECNPRIEEYGCAFSR